MLGTRAATHQLDAGTDALLGRRSGRTEFDAKPRTDSRYPDATHLELCRAGSRAILWLKLIPVLLTMLLGLSQMALEHRWHDRRTRAYRYAKYVVIVFFVVCSIATGVVVWSEHTSSIELTSTLAEIREQNETLGNQVGTLEDQLQDARSSRISGFLLPSNEERPQHDCGPIPEDALALFFGNGVAWVDSAQNSIPLLSIGSQTIVTLEREPGGVYLSAIVLRKDGRGVATIIGNRFGINPNNFFKLTSKDRHELRIVDADDSEVLHARFLNENTFQLTGVFYVGPNRALVVGPDKISAGGTPIEGHLCIGENKIGTGIFGF